MTHARRVCMAALAAAACIAVPATALAQQGDPTAVVAMGDSAISGEAARNYELGTDQPGNYCHRSLNALIKETDIPGIAAELNLACSGAESANLQYPGTGQNNEVSQGQKLRDLIDDYDVRMIIVEVGANDDPDFTGVVTDCVAQFVLQVPIGCRWTIGLQWSGRLARMKPKVKATLQSIRAVIRDFGDGDAPQLVLASYWSPVGAANRYSSYWSKVLNGCPIYNADQAWAKNTAVPALNTTMRTIATEEGWRFLDFSRSMNGREICAPGIGHSQEWVAGLTYDPASSCWYCFDAVRQSFHVNALGHAALGDCVREFYGRTEAQAACVRGPDNTLHATP